MSFPLNLEQSSYLVKVSRKVNHQLVIRYEWNTWIEWE